MSDSKWQTEKPVVQDGDKVLVRRSQNSAMVTISKTSTGKMQWGIHNHRGELTCAGYWEDMEADAYCVLPPIQEPDTPGKVAYEEWVKRSRTSLVPWNEVLEQGWWEAAAQAVLNKFGDG